VNSEALRIIDVVLAKIRAGDIGIDELRDSAYAVPVQCDRNLPRGGEVAMTAEDILDRHTVDL
jgi:hypothetical protein